MVKKIFISLFVLPAFIATAQVPKTIKAAYDIQQADNKIINQRIDSIISLLKPQPPVNPKPEPIAETGDIEKYVDAYYTATGFANNTIKAVKGKDLPYVGIGNPSLGHPHLNKAGELVFQNQPVANFKIQTRDNNNPFNRPEEVTMVVRLMPGQEWEAIMSGWGNYYIGFAGIDAMRAMRSDCYFKEKTSLKYFQLSFIHVRYEDVDNGKGKATAWINGVKLGEVITPDASWGKRLGYGVGIETNSADFNWLATMFIERSMSDTERESYFKAINENYKIGSYPTLPYASDVVITKSGSTYSLSRYTYNGSVSENKNALEITWYERSSNSNGFVYRIIGSGKSINYSGGHEVTAKVKVFDINSNSYMPVNSNFLN